MHQQRALPFWGRESREITHSQESQEESYPPASELSLPQQGNTASISHVKIQSAAPWRHLCKDGAADDSGGRATCGQHHGAAYVTHTPWGLNALRVPKGTTAHFPSSGDVAEALGKWWLCRALHLFLKGILRKKRQHRRVNGWGSGDGMNRWCGEEPFPSHLHTDCIKSILGFHGNEFRLCSEGF